MGHNGYMKKRKTYAFIDSQNLNLGVKSQGWSLDWRKFRQYLRNKYGVEKAYLFIGYLEGNERLYTFLQNAGFVCVFKPTMEIKKGREVTVKGNVDAELVLYSMIEYDVYDQAIIVSGDGDFHCLVEYLEERGKLLNIMVPNRKYSGLLRKFNNRIVRVDFLRKSLEFIKSKKKTKISGRSKP